MLENVRFDVVWTPIWVRGERAYDQETAAPAVVICGSVGPELTGFSPVVPPLLTLCVRVPIRVTETVVLPDGAHASPRLADPLINLLPYGNACSGEDCNDDPVSSAAS